MRNFIVGFITCFMIVAFFTVRYIWPTELDLIFNGIFWSSIALFIMSSSLVAFLYFKKPTSETVLFVFSLLLIVTSALMYSGFEEIAANTEEWKPALQAHYPWIYVWLTVLVNYTKNIISFGFAAIGASLCAGVIAYRFYRES